MSIFSPPPIPFGLDISERSLKLIGLTKKGNKSIITSHNEVKMPAGLIVDGEIKEKAKIISLIQKLIAEAKGQPIKNKTAVSCLPEAKTFIKLARIAKVPEEQLEKKIQEEIARHIPISPEEIYFDWQIIKRGKNYLEIIVGLAPQKIVEDYTNLLNEAGLLPLALEIEAQAITRALIKPVQKKQNAVPETKAFLDLGATRSSFIAADNNTIFFTVNLAIAGQNITKQIAQALKQTEKNAEKSKIKCSIKEKECNPSVKKIMSAAITSMATNIQESISFFDSHFPKRKKITSVTLCGGGANIINVDKILSEKLNLNIYKADPLTSVELGLGLEKMTSKDLLSYTTAIGLALRYANKKNNL